MFKKSVSLAVCAVMALTQFASCGNSAKSTLKSKYCSIYGISANPMSPLDEGLENSIQEVKDIKEAPSISFDKKKNTFTIIIDSFNNNARNRYDGDYKIKDGKIIFEYESIKSYDLMTSNGEVQVEVSINEKISDNETYINQLRKSTLQKDMKKFNESGTYPEFLNTKISQNDKAIGGIPIIGGGDGIWGPIGSRTYMLKPMGEFLCTDLYGLKLKDKYKKGKDFTISYDIEKAYSKNPNSRVNTGDWDKEEFDRILENHKVRVQSESLKTEIRFSDGTWEYYNAENKLLSSGSYEESDDYKGLISMDIELYEGDSFPNAVLLYIADDGNIYYPAFISMD